VPEGRGEGDVDAAAHLWAAMQIVDRRHRDEPRQRHRVAAAANGSIPCVIGLPSAFP
jgi:hypothetical protein